MIRLFAGVLVVVVACLGATWPVAAAGRYDGSVPMICAVTSLVECTADGKCERSGPQEGNNLPPFIRIDVKGGVLSANDGSGRKTDIKGSTTVGQQIMLQGVDNGKAWNIVIGSDTGRWGGSVVENDGSFAIFGACTLP